MQSVTLIVLAALVAVALAGGQYYVPRAYYTIDDQGHASPPVPLRRLRRSLAPYPYGNPGLGSGANANAQAGGWGAGGTSANVNAIAHADAAGSNGGWAVPSGGYGASNPLGAGQYRRQSGPIAGGRSVTASSSIGFNSSGSGYYDQYTAVSN